MSGIEELKQKTKLSMDEMYEDQSVGKMEKNQAGQPDIQLTNNLEKHPTNKPSKKPVVQKNNHPPIQETIYPANQLNNKLSKQLNDKMDIQENSLMENHATKQPPLFPTKQMQTQKMPACKMTFNLSEGIYKAFNDLYAQRMLQGRKTEKSDLICEAIQWLIKMEEDQIS